MSLPPLWTSQHDLFLCAHERVNIPLRQIIRQIRVHFPSLSVYPIKVSALERRIEMLEFEDNDYWVRDVRGYRWAAELEGAEGDCALSRGAGLVRKGGGLGQSDFKETKRRRDARSYYGLTGGGGGGGDFGFARPVEISTQGLEVVEDGANSLNENTPTQGVYSSEGHSKLPGGVVSFTSNMQNGQDAKSEKARKADQYLLTLKNNGLQQ